MILDERTEFADAVTAVSNASTRTLRGDVIDLEAAGEGPAMGAGFNLYVVITIDTAFVSANNNPTRFVVSSDSVAAIAVDGSETQHVTSQDFLPADLTAGTKIVLPLPAGAPAYERFLGIVQDVGAGASGITAGAFSAYLTPDAGEWKSLPDAVN